MILTPNISQVPQDDAELRRYVEAYLRSIREDMRVVDSKDHGNFDGLADDDHTQYSLVAGTRAFTGTVAGVTPTDSTHLVTKAYVDNLINTAWTTWTPSITQSGAVTHTVGSARYRSLGKIINLYCDLDVTGAGTGANAIIVGGLPTNIAGSPDVLGAGLIVDTGTAGYACSVRLESVSTVSFNGFNTTGKIGVDPNFALANGDSISFMITYEIA